MFMDDKLTLDGRWVRKVRQLHDGRYIALTGWSVDGYALVDVQTGIPFAVATEAEVAYKLFNGREWEEALTNV